MVGQRCRSGMDIANDSGRRLADRLESFRRKPIQFHRAAPVILLQCPVDKPETPVGNPVCHASVGGQITNIIMQRASPRHVELPESITSFFELPEQMSFKPIFRIRIMIFQNMANAHQNTPTIAQYGIKRGFRIVSGSVPVSADQSREPEFKSIQVVKDDLHLPHAMPLSGMGTVSYTHLTLPTN